MRHTLPVLLSVLALLLAPAVSPARAAVTETAQGMLHEYCADVDNSAHPGTVTVLQPIMSDRFAGPGPHALLLGYQHTHRAQSQHQHQHRLQGRLLGNALLIRADGSRQLLARMRHRLRHQGDPPFGLHLFHEQLRAGDMIRWRVRLRDMDRLHQGDCFLLYTAVATP